MYYGLDALDALVRDYAIECSLGSGGYGNVYRMRLRNDPDKVYAVKVTRFRDGHTQTKALKEVEALRLAGEHPGICTLVAHYTVQEQQAICKRGFP